MYLTKAERRRFIPFVEKVVKAICREESGLVNRAELFGYFLERLLLSGEGNYHFKSHPDLVLTKTLFDNSKAIYDRLEFDDILKTAEYIKFIVCAVLWGIIGDSMHSKTATSGARSYVNGVLLQIQNTLSGSSGRINRMMQGVILDVIQETYRKKTARFEDNQAARNGNIWPLREITWVETAPYVVQEVPEEEFDE